MNYRPFSGEFTYKFEASMKNIYFVLFCVLILSFNSGAEGGKTCKFNRQKLSVLQTKAAEDIAKRGGKTEFFYYQLPESLKADYHSQPYKSSYICPQVSTKPKNVILLIGDGMGLGHIELARAAASGRHGKLYMERLPVTGLRKTYSWGSSVTDSSAAGTALSAGIKTINGYIGLDPQQTPVKTLPQYFKEQGKSTGIVVTSPLTHATPGAFYAQQTNRYKIAKIAQDFLKKPVDLAFGSGWNDFVPKGKGGIQPSRNLINELKQAGYQIIAPGQDLNKAVSSKVVGFTGRSVVSDSNPRWSLSFMTQKAISILSKNKKVFFLMVEGSQIDWRSHNNDAKAVIESTLAFDQAVKVAADYAAANKDTLVIVTADHETGGLSIPIRCYDGKIMVNWGSVHHTSASVPLFAFGPGQNRFNGVQDITDTPREIAKLCGFKNFPGRNYITEDPDKFPIANSNKTEDIKNKKLNNELQESLLKAEVDLNKKNNFYFIQASDSHMTLKDGIPVEFFNEINNLSPKPAFLVITGDLITNAPHTRKEALKTYHFLRQQLNKLDKKIPLYLIPGNHDTYPDFEGKCFQEVFPEQPLYRAVSHQGVRFIMGNTRSGGTIDDKQFNFLKNEINNLNKTPAVLMLHQVGLNGLVHEWNSGQRIYDLLKNYKGRIWALGGHTHKMSTRVFKLPHGEISASTIPPLCPHTFNGGKGACYVVYGVKNGKIKVRLLRDTGKRGYVQIPQPNWAQLRKYPRMWQGVNGIISCGTVNSDFEKKLRLSAKAAFLETLYCQIKELTYRIPLKIKNNEVKRIALVSYFSNKEKAFFQFSRDGKKWLTSRFPAKHSAPCTYIIKIPKEFHKSNYVLLRIKASEKYGDAFSGIALLK